LPIVYSPRFLSGRRFGLRHAFQPMAGHLQQLTDAHEVVEHEVKRQRMEVIF
jgi:hypothetical protein